MPLSENWFEEEVMHRAAIDGDLKEIKRLISSGYPVNIFDDIGCTPLHYAVQYKHYKIAKFLLESNANVNARHEETNSNTPIAMAAEGDYPELVSLLLSFGADPYIEGWMGLNACHRAEMNKSEAGSEIRSILSKIPKS
ncbi:ankyrin repeat domain-containing protein [Chitinimonas sp. PSY-7]|uniref:ankyrin repeat domain-containing protein n=1 Tax=Chitinimonas sp. PSY-7 TaxID=3459088 RepID=UPI00404014AC